MLPHPGRFKFTRTTLHCLLALLALLSLPALCTAQSADDGFDPNANGYVRTLAVQPDGKLIVDAGYGPGYKYFSHRLGHGIGMDMHEWYYLVEGNTRRIQPGMTFSDEPGIYIPDEFGVRLEDDMHITDDGARWFTPQSPSIEQPFG